MRRYFLLLFILSSLSILFLSANLFLPDKEAPKLKRIKSTASPKAPREAKKARDDFFFMMLRDPKTGKIPANITSKEQEFSKMLSAQLRKNGFMNTAASMDWVEAGPVDVGGRTRALAIDAANPSVIIAGGVSGGIWKSTDNGNSWSMKSSTNHLLSVSSIAQDPRPGFTNIWYYTTGEFSGNTASDRGYGATFYGNGIYKSVDNGESWAVITSTLSNDPIGFDGIFDFAMKVVVNPQTGSVFVASNAFGISKSSDGGNSFQLNLGGMNDHIYADVVVSQNGTLLASLSSPFSGETSTNSPGIYKSTNDGQTWTNITPNSFPASHNRTVLAIAPSNQNTAYVYTYTGSTNNNREDVRFFKLNLANNTYIDRSSNLPDFGNDYQDFILTQGGYNMALAVKPDDENLVLIGASSLFRSFDGFATKPTSARLGLIGGYWYSSPWRYPNIHPDIHSFVFDPNDPAKVWFGHDGGLSYCSNIAATNYTQFLPWQNKNNNYNVTQFYTIAIPPDANDNRIMGGTQDNGTPYFTFNGTNTSASTDVSSGDGAYCYFGENYAYTSSQNGYVTRKKYNSQGMPDDNVGWSVIQPENATNQLFINPFVVDPNNENVMYYAAGTTLWRNNTLSAIPEYQNNGTSVGWSTLSTNIPQGYVISALSVSKSPAYVLYFGASNYSSGAPKIYRLNNSAASDGNPVDISIAGTTGYVHDIAINPDNSEEIIVVLSNYNITGLYYSNNGGQSFTAIEGNLEGNNQNPGPSLRTANILPSSNGTIYLVGTSIGLFSTKTLSGNNTTWTQESPNKIGNVVIEKITSRTSDNRIVAATHGRGAFVTTAGSVAGNPLAALDIQDLTVRAKPGQTGTSKFLLRNNGDAQLNFNITATGQFQLLSSGYKIKTLASPRRSNISFINNAPDAIKPAAVKNNKPGLNKPSSVSGDDVIIYDDGNDNADLFLGFGNKTDFGWANEYELQRSFSLEKFQFFMKSENALVNEVYVAVQNQSHGVVAEGTLSLQTSAAGTWYSVDLTNPVSFAVGEKFYVFVQTKNNIIDYPAGIDDDAQVAGKSYYKSGINYINLSTTDYKTHAFLIRPVGTLSGGNRLAINPSSGSIPAGGSQEISITLDASGLGEGNYNGQASIITNGGNITLPLTFIVNNSVDVKNEESNPESFYLSQNFPNPFNPSTTIKYGLQNNSDVKLTIFNSNGEVVAELLNTHQPAGNYQVTWNGKDNKGNLVSSGIYFYRLEADKNTYARKMLLMK